ncbi:ribosomal 50S subunit-recycling heat shock protein [Staphylococcus hominis]
MRLDKYLKVSRLVKRRTLAKEISDQGRVTINGNVAKAGTDVKVDDELVIRFGQKSVTVKVTGLSEHASKENAKNMYELIKEERVQQSEEA